MKKLLCQLVLVLTVASLTACGLKGPLYFPKDEQTKAPVTQTTPTMPSATDGQTPVMTSEQSAQSAQ